MRLGGSLPPRFVSEIRILCVRSAVVEDMSPTKPSLYKLECQLLAESMQHEFGAEDLRPPDRRKVST